MKKLCNVVMLPTEKESTIAIHRVNKDFAHYDGIEITDIWNFESQHLYIASDDEIKEGDNNWCIYDNQVILNDIYCQATLKDCKKIIATTDKSLIIAGTEKWVYPPQISESFIKAFVESDGSIKEVMVEYSEMYNCPCKEKLSIARNWWNKDESMNCKNEVEDHYNHGLTCFNKEIIIKTRPDNTIIISQAKTYTRDEVEKLIYSFATKVFNEKFDIKDVKDWIENNL